MILAPVFYDGDVALVVEVTPASFAEFVAGASGTTVGSATATVNGAAPFLITWTSNNGSLLATTPNAATTTFDYSGMAGVLDFETATVEVVVQDAFGNIETFYYSAYVMRTS